MEKIEVFLWKSLFAVNNKMFFVDSGHQTLKGLVSKRNKYSMYIACLWAFVFFSTYFQRNLNDLNASMLG